MRYYLRLWNESGTKQENVCVSGVSVLCVVCLCSGRPAAGPDVESSPSVSFPLAFSFFSL